MGSSSSAVLITFATKEGCPSNEFRRRFGFKKKSSYIIPWHEAHEKQKTRRIRIDINRLWFEVISNPRGSNGKQRIAEEREL